MRKLFNVLLLAVLCCTFTACSSLYDGMSKPPASSEDLEDRNYEDVVLLFEEKGFTNIKTEAHDDLIVGWLTDEGDVEEVSVGGDVEYSPDEWVDSDTLVVIRYHTFRDEGAEDEDSENDGQEEEILSKDNSSELAAILTTKDEFDPLIKQFSDKYKGRTIEFDGYTAYVTHHGDYKTRFDYLICVGDYNSSPVVGPQFQINDVNYDGLHLTGDDVPDTFGTGLNIHVVAEVGTYNESSGLFQIYPVRITMR